MCVCVCVGECLGVCVRVFDGASGGMDEQTA